MTPERRDELEEEFASAIVDSMDMKTLVVFATETIVSGFKNENDTDFINQIIDTPHEHLLTKEEIT